MATMQRGGDLLETNTHSMSGKPVCVTPDEAYGAPIDAQRRAFLNAFLTREYPGADTTIHGAYWNYDLTESKDLHENSPIGHYRADIDNQPLIVCVNAYTLSDALSLGGEAFALFKAEGVDTIGAIPFDDGAWTKSRTHTDGESYGVHLEEFRPGSKSLFAPDARLDGRGAQIGEMAGRFITSGRKAPKDLWQRWEGFSDSTQVYAMREGLKLFENGAGIAAAKNLLKPIRPQAALRSSKNYQICLTNWRISLRMICLMF